MQKIFLFGVISFILTSCSMQQTTSTSKTLGIYGSGVIQKPVLTNLKVNPQKLSSSYSGITGKDIAYHKSQAIAKLMAEGRADVIIEPAYEIVKSAAAIKITTTGYAGRYENFRQMVAADSSLLMDIGIIDYNKSRDEAPAHEASKKKGSGGLLLLLILLGLTAGLGGSAL